MTSLADGFADSNRKMHLLRSCLNTTALDEAFNAACCNQTEAAVTYGKTRKRTAGERSLRLHYAYSLRFLSDLHRLSLISDVNIAPYMYPKCGPPISGARNDRYVK